MAGSNERIYRSLRGLEKTASTSRVLNLAALAYSVIEIDGIPRAVPTAERQIESTIAELGDTGLKALIEQISSEPNDDLLSHGEPAGNALGTPS